MKKVHELVKLPIFANIDLVLWFAVYWTASTLSMLTAVPCTLSVWPRPRWLYSIYMSSANQDGAWNSLWRYLSIRHCVESRPCTYILQTDPGLPVPTSQCPLHTVHAVPSVLVVLGSIIALARWFRRPVNLNVQYVQCTYKVAGKPPWPDFSHNYFHVMVQCFAHSYIANHKPAPPLHVRYDWPLYSQWLGTEAKRGMDPYCTIPVGGCQN